MQYTNYYKSPLGGILMACDDIGLTGLWFDGQKYFAYSLDRNHEEKSTVIFDDAKRWLDIYFSGEEPDFTPALHMIGTKFQIAVWRLLIEIPYGKVTTYKEIANQIAEQKGIDKMSAQAVGGAVGRNNISLIVPCHRVVGTNGDLTGYAGGIDKKIELMRLENADM